LAKLYPNPLERLARYEVHLDRKLGAMLAMLFKLRGIASCREPRLNPFRQNQLSCACACQTGGGNSVQ